MGNKDTITARAKNTITACNKKTQLWHVLLGPIGRLQKSRANKLARLVGSKNHAQLKMLGPIGCSQQIWARLIGSEIHAKCWA